MAGAKVLVGVLPYFPHATPTIVGLYQDEKDGDVRRFLFGAVIRSALVYWSRDECSLENNDKKLIFELMYDGLGNEFEGVNEVALTSLSSFTPVDDFFITIKGKDYKESIIRKVENILFEGSNPKLRKIAAVVLPQLKGMDAINVLQSAYFEEGDFKVQMSILDSLSKSILESKDAERALEFIRSMADVLKTAKLKDDKEKEASVTAIKEDFEHNFNAEF